MWISLFFVLSGSLLVKSTGNEVILGKGQWIVLNIQQCENPDQYEVPVVMTRRKINRTHDCFSLHIDQNREIDVTFGVELVGYKEVDGGFKYYQTISDVSFCNFVERYGGNNFRTLLTMANIDPPRCPIPAGTYNIEEFVMNYKVIVENGVYGTYDMYMYLSHMGKRIICIRWLVRFEKEHEHDDDYDEDYVEDKRR